MQIIQVCLSTSSNFIQSRHSDDPIQIKKTQKNRNFNLAIWLVCLDPLISLQYRRLWHHICLEHEWENKSVGENVLLNSYGGGKSKILDGVQNFNKENIHILSFQAGNITPAATVVRYQSNCVCDIVQQCISYEMSLSHLGWSVSASGFGVQIQIDRLTDCSRQDSTHDVVFCCKMGCDQSCSCRKELHCSVMYSLCYALTCSNIGIDGWC